VNGKVCIVTGANVGLGKAAASGLARLGATVILACRDRARGAAAQDDIRSSTGNSAVDLMLVDLAAQRSIRDMVTAFRQRHTRLDVLINNAAIFTRRRTVTPDGLEAMFATNHLGPFLLTNLLLDVLKSGAPARVITVSAPSTTELDFADLQSERHFNAFTAFGASKMGNLLFTYALARRLAGTGVTANVVHPGLMRSNLMRETPAVMRWPLRLISAPPEKAAQAPVYLASSPAVERITGTFFKGERVIASNDYSRDQQVQDRLWDVSSRLAQLE
jgi:NAD(P)-dependent dehydrogenase (short-subunit alcohol dehydrogenase family)